MAGKRFKGMARSLCFWGLIAMIGLQGGAGLWAQEPEIPQERQETGPWDEEEERSGKIRGYYPNLLPMISKAGVPALGGSLISAGEELFAGALGRVYLGQAHVLAIPSFLTFVELFGEVGYYRNTHGSPQDPAFVLHGLGMNMSFLFPWNRWIPIIGLGLGQVYNQNEISLYLEPRIGMVFYHGIHVSLGYELGGFMSGIVGGWRHNLVLSLSL